MGNVLSRVTIKKDPRSGSREDQSYPSTSSRRETHALREVQNIIPSHRVKSFSNVQLVEQGRCAILVKPARNIPDIHEVVVDNPGLDESALAARDNVIHLGAQPQGHSLHDDLRDYVD